MRKDELRTSCSHRQGNGPPRELVQVRTLSPPGGWWFFPGARPRRSEFPRLSAPRVEKRFADSVRRRCQQGPCRAALLEGSTQPQGCCFPGRQSGLKTFSICSGAGESQGEPQHPEFLDLGLRTVVPPRSWWPALAPQAERAVAGSLWQRCCGCCLRVKLTCPFSGQ